MKKFLITLLICLFAVPSFAAWTIQAEIDDVADWNDGAKVYRVRVYMLSDGTDLAEFNLSTYLSSPQTDTQGKTHTRNYWTERLMGGVFYMVETDPGTAPDAAYTLSFDSDKGADILDLTGLSTTVTELNDASGDLGFFPILWDLQIDIGDIGSNNDVVDLYIYIIR
ncbi:MAG: hypothetical protein ACYTFW_00875 [Planctomycetota bacterium]|jgi:type II secretory pathway pseudopilin PulG